MNRLEKSNAGVFGYYKKNVDNMLMLEINWTQQLTKTKTS